MGLDARADDRSRERGEKTGVTYANVLPKVRLPVNVEVAGALEAIDKVALFLSA